jgi:hypothetical protein
MAGVPHRLIGERRVHSGQMEADIRDRHSWQIEPKQMAVTLHSQFEPSICGLTPRQFSGMELHKVMHTRRFLASELEKVVSHAVVTPLRVEVGHRP